MFFFVKKVLKDILFPLYGGCGFQKTVDIPMGTNYVPFPADLFLYLYQLDIMLGLLKSRSYNLTIHYIDDVFSLNNSIFDDYVSRIYTIDLKILQK